jgi:hypothetical protein
MALSLRGIHSEETPVTPKVVKLEPTGSDDEVWKVSVADEHGETPVDFMRVPDESRSFVGAGGYFEAEPDADGWRLISRADAKKCRAGWAKPARRKH